MLIETKGPRFVRQALAALFRACDGEGEENYLRMAMVFLLEPYPIHVSDHSYAMSQLRVYRRIEETCTNGRWYWRADPQWLDTFEADPELEAAAPAALQRSAEHHAAVAELLGRPDPTRKEP